MQKLLVKKDSFTKKILTYTFWNYLKKLIYVDLSLIGSGNKTIKQQKAISMSHETLSFCFYVSLFARHYMAFFMP